MAINFPTSLDTLTNPTKFDTLDSVDVPHAEQHADVNDAVEALEAKVGIDGSADTDSIDYKLNLIFGLVGSGTAKFVGGDLYIQCVDDSKWYKFVCILQGGIPAPSFDDTPLP